MSTQIIPFEFKGAEVRTVLIDAEPWFVLADLAKVLGIIDVQRLNSRLEDGVRQTHPIEDRMGRTQNATIVSEAGMYEVVIRSDKPEAAALRRWITGTVLPEIRKTGSYVAPLSLEQRSLALMGELTAVVEKQRAEIIQLKPSAEAWDDLASGDGTYAVGDVAKILTQAGIKTGRDRLFDYMRRIGWVYRQSNRWQARQTAVDTGRLAHNPQSHEHPETGERILDAPQVRVTIKGVEQLRGLLLPPVTELAVAS